MGDRFGMATMRIHRPSTRAALTVLNDCEPPHTCITADARPCLGRILLISSGSQSILLLETPVTVSCYSELHQTCPSDRAESAQLLRLRMVGWNAIGQQQGPTGGRYGFRRPFAGAGERLLPQAVGCTSASVVIRTTAGCNRGWVGVRRAPSLG